MWVLEFELEFELECLRCVTALEFDFESSNLLVRVRASGLESLRSSLSLSSSTSSLSSSAGALDRARVKVRVRVADGVL